MTESLWVRIGLRVATILVLGFLYLPLVILGIYAFNESRSQAWPPTSFSLDWFIDAAAKVGRAIAEKARAAGIERVAFDRSGYRYHGRIKALAEAAREGGLQF